MFRQQFAGRLIVQTNAEAAPPRRRDGHRHRLFGGAEVEHDSRACENGCPLVVFDLDHDSPRFDEKRLLYRCGDDLDLEGESRFLRSDLEEYWQNLRGDLGLTRQNAEKNERTLLQ